MDKPSQPSSTTVAVLWDTGALRCTSRTIDDRIEISLVVVGVTISTRVFHDVHEAGTYAIETMRAYNAH